MVLTRTLSLPELRPQVDEAVAGLEDWLDGYGFAGWDPYDALNSPVLRALSLGLKYPRIAFTQALRRLPVNLRPALGIRRSYNPKGLGLFLGASARRFAATGDQRHRERVVFLARKLGELRQGRGWGYPFPWQSRAFFVPRWTPTIVNTSFVAHALLDAADACGEEDWIRLAREACDFVLRDLNRHEEDGALCFSYTPIDELRVHNANMLGAALLARVGARTGEEELLDAARAATRYLLRYQRPDGSWWYAEPEYQHWIDSFHTGFNLEALARVLRYAGGRGIEGGAGALARGHRFFLEHFYEEDGAPKYYHDRREPLDIHCPTQGFVTMTALWDVQPAPDLLARSATWFLTRMRAPEGYFYYRLGRRPNRIPYLRWGQAWAYHGLVRLQEFLGGIPGPAPGADGHG